MKLIRVFLTMCLVAGVAAAQEPLPSVAPFPLEFARTPAGVSKKEREDLQKIMPLLLRGADASVPDSARMADALEKLKRQDCEREDVCLSKLAERAGSLYGLYAQLDFNSEGYVIATGRVVRDDGVAMGKAVTVKVLKGSAPYKDVARESLSQLFTGLGVKGLSPFRPAPVAKVEPKVEASVVKPPEVVSPPPPPPPVEPPSSAMRTAGLVLVGAGTVGVVAGTARFVTAGAYRVDARGNVYQADAEKVGGVQAASALGVGLMGVGAGLAAAGAVVFAIAPGPVRVSGVPLSGGGAIVVGGTFQ